MSRIEGTHVAGVLAVVLALLLPNAATAQTSRTIYDAHGRVQSRTHTDSQGSTVIYDSSGRVSGRTSTDSSGTTTIYDASGRKTGSITAPKTQQGK